MGIGAVAGMTEVLVMQPSVAVKNALQEGRPVPWGNPTQLYRGLVVGQLAPPCQTLAAILTRLCLAAAWPCRL